MNDDSIDPFDDPRNHIVSWVEVHRDTKFLVRKLMPMGPWKGIIALTRGGLVPAAILAREMDIRVLDTLCIATYEEKEMGTASSILKTPEAAHRDGGKGWILVDDLVDTGTTMRAAREVLPHAHFATVYAKPEGTPLVDTFVHEVPQDVWIFFPWDTQLQYVQPMAKGRKG